MSGIVGLWNLDGTQLEASVLDAMSAAIAHRGLDGSSRLVVGSVGFAHHRLWTTPEEMGEVQPLTGRDSTMLVMDGRLDNRDDLIAALGQPASASDAALALAAFAAWDDAFAERLNGDFAVAVFDARCRRLILARDSIGLRPIYYTRTGRLFAFASEIKALLAHPDVTTRLDDEGIADYLLVSSRPIDRQDITCFEGISALVPAHVAVTTLERTFTRRYWGLRYSAHGSAAHVRRVSRRVQRGSREAVRRRIRAARPVAVSVSGGFDSSSIFCQAETLRRAQKVQGGPLVGISWLGEAGTTIDEGRYVDAIEAAYGVRIERIPVEPLVGLVQNQPADTAPPRPPSWN